MADYENGTLEGDVLTYWGNGTPKREDLYSVGKLIEGKCWDKEGNEITHFAFMKMPNPTFDMNKHIKNNIIYPKEARDKFVSGRVLSGILVTQNGDLCTFEILISAGQVLDNEVLRVLKTIPKWEPAICDGEIINSEITYPVHFTLNQRQ